MAINHLYANSLLVQTTVAQPVGSKSIVSKRLHLQHAPGMATTRHYVILGARHVYLFKLFIFNDYFQLPGVLLSLVR